MKTFTEALLLFETNIQTYQKSCEKSNGKVLKNYQAFFKNLLPFTQHHGGITGHERATNFLKELHEIIKRENLFQTQDLIKFALNYPDKGDTLSEYIYQSIREAAGFEQKHINYLAHMYAEKDGARDRWDEPVLSPSSNEAQIYAKKLINTAIKGNYHRKLIQYLNSNLGLNNNCLTELITKSNCQKEDFGQKLLIGLESKLNQKEEIEVVELKSSQNRP